MPNTGKVMELVMMKTITKDVNGMEETAVETTLRRTNAKLVNVWILTQDLPKDVRRIAIKVIIIVMMETIMQVVNGMEEIVVVAMVIQINFTIVQHVNAWILNLNLVLQLPQLPQPPQRQPLNHVKMGRKPGKVMVIVMMLIIMKNVTGMEGIAVE